MADNLYKNKYRIKSARREEYDYAQDGYYFVTICTAGRELFFGNIAKTAVRLSEIGKIADRLWRDIPNHFPFVILDEWIVMPNHIHGIIIINNGSYSDNAGNLTSANNGTDVYSVTSANRDEACLVSTDAGNTSYSISRKMQRISPNPKSLPVIIGSYKSAVTRGSKIVDSNFIWQTRFYDHIIRNDESLNKIRQYIIDNPLKWVIDRNNPENLWM